MGHFFGELVLLLLAWGFTGFVVVGIYRFFSNPVETTLDGIAELTDTKDWNYGTQDKPWYR